VEGPSFDSHAGTQRPPLKEHSPAPNAFLAALAAVTVVALAAGGYAYYVHEVSAVRAERYDELAAIADLKVEQIVAWRNERLRDARLNSSGVVRDHVLRLASAPGDAASTTALLTRLEVLRKEEGYRNVALATPNGRLMLSADVRPVQLDAAAEEMIARAVAAGDPVFGDLFRCTICGEIHLDLAAPILDEAKRPVAVLLLRSDPETLIYPVVRSWPLPTTSAETLLVRRDGDGLLFLNSLRFRPDPPLSRRDLLSDTERPTVQAVLGRTGVFEGKDYRGVDVIAYLRPVPESPWFIVAKADTSEAFGEARYHGTIVLLLVLLCGVVVVILAGFVASVRRRRLYQALHQTETQQRLQLAEQSRVVLRSLGEGVLTTDSAGRVTQMSSVAESLTGWSEAESLKRSVHEIFRVINAETREATGNPVERVLRDGGVVGLADHTVLIAKDGTERPITCNGAPIRDENGSVLGVVLAFSDQTRERAAHEALQLSERRLRRFYESGLLGVIYWNVSGAIIDANDKFLEMTGYSREDLAADRVDLGKMTPPEYRYLDESAAIGLKYAGVNRVPYEKEYIRKDGTRIPVLLAGATLDEARLNGVAFVLDITEHKQTQNTLRRSLDTQAAVASVVHLSLEDLSLDQLLRQTLRIVLAIPWLSVEQRGSILLVGDEPGVLLTRAEEGLAEEIKRRCARVPFGVCLCGRAAASGQIVFAGCLDARHENTYPGITPHGHYCVPISYSGTVYGVLNMYLATGHAFSESEAGFLTAVTNALAGVLARRKMEEKNKALEEQFRASQKMDAIGSLAGGVAHDFNNLLAVIMSYTGFAMGTTREGDPLHADLAEIQKAAERATALTRQLLAFSRKQVLQPVPLSLNQIAVGIGKMLRRILGEDIDIVQVLAPDLGVVRADPSQIEQVFMNLVVNARDAMPHGGKLTIETANVEIDEEYASRHVAVTPGPHVQLVVTDTGCGMDEQTKARIFEPFFTTKDKGKGTGLGLSTVYGIVKQSGGNIWVYSEPGHGTTFRIYLPREPSATATAVKAPAVLMPATGTETVLVVEDEQALRKVASRSLAAAGYTVLAAADGDEALRTAAQHAGDIHLLLTDVVMPRMNGRALAQELSKTRPKLKVVYMSGYTDNAIVHHGVLDAGTHFIGKPFTATDLTRKVREVLDSGPPDGAGQS
jgi:two-component system, cell cycle sensor histidine kinase and response regulator CckA